MNNFYCCYELKNNKSNLLSFLLSTLQMLTNIENRLEELFERIEMMPPDKVELAEKVSNF